MAVLQTSWASQSPLSDRENLPPNQSTWMETAEQMRAKQPKQSRPTNTLPAATATEQSVKNPNPYSSGLRSGKDATPDAQTTAQNADARACAATASDVGPPPPKWWRKRAESPPPPPAAFAPHTSASTPSASLAWYPTHPAYHTRIRSISCILAPPRHHPLPLLPKHPVDLFTHQSIDLYAFLLISK